MQDLAEQIGALVTLALSPPTMGVGGGSRTEEREQDMWKARVRAEWTRLRAHAAIGSPEERILDAITGGRDR